jgi:hypothetical protein
MPYLHWATSDHPKNERSALIKKLSEDFKDPSYKRPSCKEIEEVEIEKDEISYPCPLKRKIIRAFLFPVNDRCLHIRRTLDQYYYNTLSDTDIDQRTPGQVVYKFAKRQHRNELKEKEKADRQKNSTQNNGSLAECKNQNEKHAKEPEWRQSTSPGNSEEEEKQSWDPPKILMVNQLWVWIVDCGKSLPYQ